MESWTILRIRITFTIRRREEKQLSFPSISKIGFVEITCNPRLVVAFCATKFTVPPGMSTPERILLSWVLKLYVFLHNWKLEIIIVAPSGASRYGTKPYENALRDRPRLCKDLFGKWKKSLKLYIRVFTTTIFYRSAAVNYYSGRFLFSLNEYKILNLLNLLKRFI